MLYVPEGQRVIQTWSNFNRNHSSFLGKRRISVGIFQIYKISFPGGFIPPLSRFLISFNTNILILKGKSAQLQFLHYCLPEINKVLFSKMDTGEVRWEENDRNPRKKFLKTNHLPESLKMETSSNFYSIFFSECFSNRKDTIFLEKASWRRKRRRGSWKTTGFLPSYQFRWIAVTSWVGGEGVLKLLLDLAGKSSLIENQCLLQSCEWGCVPFASPRWMKSPAVSAHLWGRCGLSSVPVPKCPLPSRSSET